MVGSLVAEHEKTPRLLGVVIFTSNKLLYAVIGGGGIINTWNRINHLQKTLC